MKPPYTLPKTWWLVRIAIQLAVATAVVWLVAFQLVARLF